MATFKAEIYKHQKKEDGTYNVKIRVTHNREKKYLSTHIFVTKEDLTTSLKIKNQSILDELEDIVREYRKKCNLLTHQETLSVSDIVEFLKNESKKTTNVDFFQFGREWIEKRLKEGRTGTARNYKSTLNSIALFLDREKLSFSEITVSFLNSYYVWLNERVTKTKGVNSTNRAASMYLGALRHLHNDAMLQYNDEDNGVMIIPHSPFTRFKVPKQSGVVRKRAIEVDQIRAIYNLPYRMKKTKNKPLVCRYNLAKDVFILSFCLIGMNSTDLFSCTQIKDGAITYERAKTKDRRADGALISVKVPFAAKRIFEIYKDKMNERIFSFYKMYADERSFNKNLNIGLKEVGKEVGVDDLEFYAARHSWATIAINDVGIDKYTVHEALNHIDEAMRVTDIYIKKDFSRINEANSKVLDFVFKKETPSE